MKLHIDLETYSSEELTTAGVYRYTEAIDFEILLFAYAFDDDPIKIVDLANGEEIPEHVIAALTDIIVEKHAHNAAFERICLRAYSYDIPASQWHCSAVKASYCGLPRSLAQVSAALDLGEEAKGAGTALINYFCKPCKPTKANGQRFRNFPHHDPEKWEEFKAYCKQDVIAERAVGRALEDHTIPDTERENYILDQKINDIGVRIDLPFAQKCVDIDTRFTDGVKAEMAQLTGLENPNSIPQLKKWLGKRFKREITCLDKEAVEALLEEILEDLDISEEGFKIIEALRFRKLLGKTSIKKYTAMLNCACLDERARGQLLFYGARTGRWSGRQIQLHNLVKNHLEELIKDRAAIAGMNYESVAVYFKDLSDILSQLVRTALIAKLGHTFIVSDFGAIEARVLSWLANEEWRMQVFRTHGKIYEASAALMFGVDIDTVTKGSDLRAKGKVSELALGYQGWLGAMIRMGGEKMGLSEEDMISLAKKWRKQNPAIVAFWGKLNAATIRCVKTKKDVRCGYGEKRLGNSLLFSCNKNSMRIELPSGRAIHYRDPCIVPGKYGDDSVSYFGKDSDNKVWGRVSLYGGKLAENITQAIARDLLADSMRDLDHRGFDICMHVHDETVVEVGKQQAPEALRGMCDIMSRENPWAKGLPLAADGYITEFYKKD